MHKTGTGTPWLPPDMICQRSTVVIRLTCYDQSQTGADVWTSAVDAAILREYQNMKNVWMRRLGVSMLLVLGQFSGLTSAVAAAAADEADDLHDAAISQALEQAGENRGQIAAALHHVPADQRPGMRFLVANMPERDLVSLTSEFLLENCDLAYREWRRSAWKDQVPEDIFLNNVLPYVSINESREPWRKDFIERFRPLVSNARTPAEAAAILNQNIFRLLSVRYSTARPKADQSPAESIRAGLASCSGLAVLLIDACRAVGVPARFVGTPRWTDNSGNHSWVEVWDDGWHFTGAAEPSGDKLDQAWFVGRAATALRDEPRHAIYAVSFRKTPLSFPLVWDRSIRYVPAVNVTDRYAGKVEPLAAGLCQMMFRVVDSSTGQRCAARLVVRDTANPGTVVREGVSRDERFDANDHVTVVLPEDKEYVVEAEFSGLKASTVFRSGRSSPLISLRIPKPGQPPKSDSRVSALEDLKDWLGVARAARQPLPDQPFAQQALTRAEAETARHLLWDDHVQGVRETRQAEMDAGRIRIGDLEMRFDLRRFGMPPASGRSLFISLHGGGGAPARVNDRQWENQKTLYEPKEGVYVAPRAPTDTWNLWHQEHMDQFLTRLIQNLVVFENVNPDRVYLLGYSAGGDGVYQLAPRMADRFAAAAMMAGHPNEASPLGLRNLPFTIHVGGQDGAYNRNRVAAEWSDKLDQLHKEDPSGYPHLVRIYPDHGHWLDRQDAAALSWMAEWTRKPLPDRIVWYQDDVTHSEFYWLSVPASERKPGTRIVASRTGQQVRLEADGAGRVIVLWNDELADLDGSVVISQGDQSLFEGRVVRTMAAISRTLNQRGDPRLVFCAESEVVLKTDVIR